MADGRAYGRTGVREVRPYHKPVPGTNPEWKCAVCGQPWDWVASRSWAKYRRHYPGTFWTQD